MTSSGKIPILDEQDVRDHIKIHYPSCMHELVNLFSVNIVEKDAVWIYLEELRDHICKLYASYDSLVKERDQLKEGVKSRQQLLRNLRQHVANTTTHIQESLYSLKLVAQSGSIDDPPEMKDIIDRNGPQRIGERFSEIFDKEWRDAFETLKKLQGRKNDVLEIQELLNTAELCHELCSTKANKQLRELENSLSFVTKDIHLNDTDRLSPHMYKHLTNFRRATASETVNIIQKEFSAVPGVVDVEVPELRKFVHACLECFWLAAIQFPPVCLEFDDNASSLFDPAENRPYTNADRYISYRVWPAMRLHKGGPLLTKGVVQCCNEKGTQFKDDLVTVLHEKLATQNQKLV